MRALTEVADGLADAPGELLGPAALFRLRDGTARSSSRRRRARGRSRRGPRGCSRPRPGRCARPSSRPSSTLTPRASDYTPKPWRSRDKSRPIRRARRAGRQRRGGSRSRRSASTRIRCSASRPRRCMSSTATSQQLVERMIQAHAGRARGRARCEPGRDPAPRVRDPGRRGAGAEGARQPGDRRALGRAGRGRRGLPVDAGRRGAGRAARFACASRRATRRGTR